MRPKYYNAVVLALVGFAWMATNDKLSIRVSPQTFMAGHDITVRCHVPRRPENRWINIGVADMTSHGVEVHGDQDDTLFSLDVKSVGCGATTAFCNLLTNNPKQEELVTANIQVGGCDPH